VAAGDRGVRILILTNFYPPADAGWGYMQLCEEVADGLSARGHDIAILTSTHRNGPEPSRPYPVYRLLDLDPDWQSGRSAARQFFVGRRWREKQGIAHLHRLTADFRPEIIFIWHAMGLPRALLHRAESLPDASVVYYLAGYLPEWPDEYLAYWQRRPVRPLARLLKAPMRWLALRLLAWEGKPVPLRFEHVICVSHYVRQRLQEQHLIPDSAVVIHNGVDINTFAPAERSWNAEADVVLLYAGRLEPEKGVHTLLEALPLLSSSARGRIREVRLVGEGEPDYVQRLQRLAQSCDPYPRSSRQTNEWITFWPSVTREAMPAQLSQADILVMPSMLEALSRMIQEAMAVGLLVIGTTAGGNGELLEHERTGLVFEPGDARGLAAQLERALKNPALAAQLAAAGQRSVRTSFRIDQTISKVEAYLQHLVAFPQ